VFRERHLGDAERFEELLEEDLAGVGWQPVPRKHGLNHLDSVVVDNGHVVDV